MLVSDSSVVYCSAVYSNIGGSYAKAKAGEWPHAEGDDSVLIACLFLCLCVYVCP